MGAQKTKQKLVRSREVFSCDHDVTCVLWFHKHSLMTEGEGKIKTSGLCNQGNIKAPLRGYRNTLREIHWRGETSFCDSETFERAGIHLLITKLSFFSCQRNLNLLLRFLVTQSVCSESHLALR